MSLRVSPATFSREPHSGCPAWGRVIKDPDDIDLKQYNGYAIKARFTDFRKSASVPPGGFLFIGSKCGGSAEKPFYVYQLLRNRLNVTTEEPDADNTDEVLVCVTEALKERHQLMTALEQLLLSDRCPVSLRDGQEDFIRQASYAIGTNTIYRAAVLCYLSFLGFIEIDEDVLQGGQNLQPSKPAPPPAPKPYVPGMRKRLIDRPPIPDDFPD